MTISDDTADLIDTSLWGESVAVRRNTPTYDDMGEFEDSWATVETSNAEIQPVTGGLVTRIQGQERTNTHKGFLSSSSAVLAGDRIRRSGWSTGDDEYVVIAVHSHEDHVEVNLFVTQGNA